MSFRKQLIKFAKRIEKSWQKIDLGSGIAGQGVKIRSGWYISEFNIQGTIRHVPELVVVDDKDREVRRSLIGFHSGRNRMLFYLPQGHISAYDKAINFDFLARVTELEGRARVLLISFRYLVDFFSIGLFFKIIAMQFQSRFELSTDVLQFYFPKNYLYEIQRWKRLKGFNWLLNSMTAGIKIAVVVEDESQRLFLDDQLVAPDQILVFSEEAKISSDIDYFIPLSSTEKLREPAIAIIKHTIKKYKKKTGMVPAMLYSDHDYSLSNAANEENGVMEPVLKPQASLAYLHCFDYVGPAVIFAADELANLPLVQLLNDEGRYRTSLELFQKPGGALHIPEALFISDRKGEQQTPKPDTEKSIWPNIDWQRFGDFNRLIASLEWQDMPSVDIIIPTRDRLDVLRPCIASILDKTDYPNFKIYIVNNNSERAETHHYFAEIALDNKVEIIEYPGEFNYSAINNIAVQKGRSDYIALVNNDIEAIHPDWLRQMMVWAVQPKVGIVGAKLLYGNGDVQHAGVTIGMGNAAGHIHRTAAGESSGYQHRLLATQNMMAVTAACFVTPRDLFEKMGGLDEEVFKVAYNDIDYCLRVGSKGFDIMWTPEARLYHHESISRGDDMSDKHIDRYFEELAALQKRWKTKGFVDKYYSKHLRINDEGVYPQVYVSDPGQLRRLDSAISGK